MRRVDGAALAGAVFGALVGAAGCWPALTRARTVEVPLPYHEPPVEGGIAFRYAMVHDVLTERYPRHGRAYYEERNRRVRAALETAGTPDERWPLADDLGAGLDFLGEHDEAVAVLRRKRAEQEAAGISGRAMYTTYANLGTFLIHGAFGEAIAGDAAARGRLEEGRALIDRAIAVNPGAHFGREAWQAVAVESILAAIDDPTLLGRRDLIGQWRITDRPIARQEPGRFGPSDEPRSIERRGEWVQAVRADPEGPPPGRVHVRRLMLTGVDEGAKRAVAFDEPCLGIIGMWRLGGGPNPHFALALAGIMERVGQQRLAWAAYSRALEMKDRFWPDPAIVSELAADCEARRRVLDFDPRFEDELAHGRRYQAAYEAYEADRIAAGDSIDDPDFDAAFRAEHGPIATAPGEADFLDVEIEPPRVLAVLPGAVFWAGLLALLFALPVRTRILIAVLIAASPIALLALLLGSL